MVAERLNDADKTEGLVHKPGGETVAHAEAEGPGHHADPSALGFDASGWVSLAMLVLIAIVIWKKVPAIVGRALDAKIAGIRAQLDEATRLRADAEALKADYEGKAAAAGAEADAMLAHARTEAAAILDQAHADAETLVERRGRMAEDKIAAAERTALAEVRAKVAQASTAAAAALIAAHHGETSDKALVDRTITGLGAGLGTGQRLN